MRINDLRPGFLGITLFILAADIAIGDSLEIDKRLAPLARTQLDLEVCSDTARSYNSDEASAIKYQEAAGKLYVESMRVGWTAEEIAGAMTAILNDQTDLIVVDGDTRKEFQVRKFSGKRCKDQLMAAEEYLEGGNIPRPESL